MMSYKGIIFDLDGTLVDSLPDLAEAMNRILKRWCFPVHDPEAYRAFIGHGMRNLVYQALPAEAREENRVNSCFEAFYREYSEHCLDITKPFQGISELLDSLSQRKISLTVFSNKVDELTKTIVSGLFSRWHFDVILGTSPDIPRKPNPQGALRISSLLKITPSQLLYLGDSGVDMETAVRAGMLPIGANWGYRSEEELRAKGAQHIISHPLELLKHLEI